jgi:hypothetical protein
MRLYFHLTTTLTLSPQKATRVLTTLALSPQKATYSEVPASLPHSLPLAARALRIALSLSPQKAGTKVGRPAACARR